MSCLPGNCRRSGSASWGDQRDAACFDVSKSEPHRLTGLLSQTAATNKGWAMS